jgi:dolichol kinase
MKRKALHIVALVVPLGMHLLGRTDALWILVPLSVLAVSADVLRAYSTAFNEYIRRVFGPLMRTEELPAAGDGIVINGATSVLVGATLLTLLFPLPIAVAVFVMTMTADAAAALVGRAVGQHPWPGRSHTMEGTAAFVVVGLLVMMPFGLGGVGTAAGVLTAAVAEASPLPVNDNIAVPLLAATMVTLVGLYV